MISNQIAARRVFVRAAGDPETNRSGQRGDLVDMDLTPEAQQTARLARLALIEPVGRRAVAVFLGRDDYEKVQVSGGLMAALLLECLPRFVHESGGQVVLAARLGDRGEVVNPVQSIVQVAGQSRPVLQHGYLFIHSPGERAVVSADCDPTTEPPSRLICVRSDVDTAGFLARWQEFAKANNYLRGRAFFADGELIRHNRRYTWDDIVLSDEIRKTIHLHVEGFLKNRDRLRALGVKGRRGLILAGPPGTGKTLLGKVLADNLPGVSFLWVSPRHVKNGTSFNSILSIARYVSPAVVFLEDLGVDVLTWGREIALGA